MNTDVLLDTNIVAALIEGDSQVRQRLATSSGVAISVVVLGELYFGAFKSAKLAENMRRINNLLSDATVLECDAETAYEFGSIKNELRLKGRPIPDHDVWIAAMARQHGMTLASRDRHFAEVDRLNWEQW
jgi:tRNA(fMet)-specific endonuclease VapC